MFSSTHPAATGGDDSSSAGRYLYQVPSPYAEWSGDSVSFSASFSSSSIRCLALLGHNLPDGATVTWSSGSTLETRNVARFKTRPQNHFTLLDADQTLTSLTCSISGAGSGLHRIAAAFAGPVWVFDQISTFRWRPRSSASVTRIDGTDWTHSGTRRRLIPMSAIGNRGEMLGVNSDGTAYSGTDAETVFATAGLHGQVIACPSQVSQSAIDALAIYGTLASAGEVKHVEGDVFRARFDVLESQ